MQEFGFVRLLLFWELLLTLNQAIPIRFCFLITPNFSAFECVLSLRIHKRFMNTTSSPTPKHSESRPRKRLHCFNCNRSESHFLAHKNRWFYSYLLGLTFGLITFIGPFRCQCCGDQRFFSTDRLHPRTWLQSPVVRKIFHK